MASSASPKHFAFFKPDNKGMIFIICFFIAAGIWVLNTLSRNYTTVFTIKLEKPGTKKDGETLIRATVNAHGFDLIQLYYKFAGIQPFPDIKTNSATGIAVVESLMGNLKTNVQLVSVTPEIITIAETGLAHKMVPVKSKLEISFQQQITAASPIMFKPDSIDISGTEDAISKVDFIETQNLKFLNTDKPIFCSVGLATAAYTNINFSAERVWLYVPVEKYTEGTVEIPLKIIHKGTTHIKLLPEKVTVTYRVPLSQYNKVKPQQFKAGVYISGFTTEDKIPVSLLEKPSFVNKVTFSPSEVTYLIFE